MKYAIDSLTGVRPTADLTVANYLGAIKPLLDAESAGERTSVFVAELHAATTHSPREVTQNAQQLGRTLIASGVQGDIYSQRKIQDIVTQTEVMVRGLTTVSRLLRLPTLKEKVTQSDNTANATVGLAMYPIMMAADIIVARPAVVPTGKDQKPHLELTSELIRAANRQFGSQLPIPFTRDVELVNIMSLDASGRKMSKSFPRSAVFLNDTPAEGRRKIMKAVSFAEPGEQLEDVVNNLMTIADGLGGKYALKSDVHAAGSEVKGGFPRMGAFKELVGSVVANFLSDMQDKRASVSDDQVIARVEDGSQKMRIVATETYTHLSDAYWKS